MWEVVIFRADANSPRFSSNDVGRSTSTTTEEDYKEEGEAERRRRKVTKCTPKTKVGLRRQIENLLDFFGHLDFEIAGRLRQDPQDGRHHRPEHHPQVGEDRST